MEKLAILDCGGQYTKVIDRKVREQRILGHLPHRNGHKSLPATAA